MTDPYKGFTIDQLKALQAAQSAVDAAKALGGVEKPDLPKSGDELADYFCGTREPMSNETKSPPLIAHESVNNQIKHRLRQMITGDILEEQLYYEEQIIHDEELSKSDDLEYPEETFCFLALKELEYRQKIAACENELARRDQQGTTPAFGAAAVDWTEKRAEILDRLDILSVFEERVVLKKNGREYVGLCPFHEDKTPSLHLNIDKHMWHCFGCQAGGSVYDFVMRAENMSFVDSLYTLGKRAGVELPARRGELTQKQGVPPPEPEIPPEAPGETQQAKTVTDDWVDPWRDAWHTLADAFAPRPPAEYAVENLIKLPSLIAWYGNPGDLKTFLLQYIFLCIAAGKPCFPEAPWKSGGRVFAVTPYPVIWLDFDNGSDLTKERFEALARAMGIDPTLPNLHYVSMPSPWLILGDPKSVGHLIHQIQQFGARAVGIDNLGTTKGAAKENTDDMIPVMSNLRQVVEATRAGLSIVHHETKSGALTARRGDSLRGHSSIEAAVDLALLIEREPGSDIVTIQSTKTRGTPVDPFSAAFTYTHKTETLELETAMFFALPCENKRSPKAIEEAIKESLANGPMLKTALAKQVQATTEGIGINRIRDYIDRMITAETITTTPGGKTTGQLCTLR